MLTPEKIAEFQARADAGEKPIMDWGQGALYTFAIVYTPFIPIRIDIITEGRKFRLSRSVNCFGSLAAAQLAAEHLIKQATQNLYAKELAELDHLRDATKIVEGEAGE